MDDMILKGARIILLIGDSGRKLGISDLECLEDSEGLEECVKGLYALGLVREENDFLYLTVNGERIYQKLQKQYSIT